MHVPQSKGYLRTPFPIPTQRLEWIPKVKQSYSTLAPEQPPAIPTEQGERADYVSGGGPQISGPEPRPPRITTADLLAKRRL